MQKLFTFLLVCCLTIVSYAQEETNDEKPKELALDTTAVLTIDKTIKSLYAAISGEKGEARHWKQFNYLFNPNAKLIPTGKDEFGEYKVHYMSPQDYKKNSKDWLEEHGFIEKEIYRKTEVFGPIAHVFSTYESYHSATDEEPFMRGINSIQLFYDGKRWWITNISWSQESRLNPIPKQYLP
ncbi:hypothetical protein [Aestuariivivens insulae]|uniref:hypothetical protein n=1 Tax=Aestuariivivens insulae TaxID=1621988 RepID=UPI001F579B82|nr:hypothetical protein [Aestuariivivens insulae]